MVLLMLQPMFMLQSSKLQVAGQVTKVRLELSSSKKEQNMQVAKVRLEPKWGEMQVRLPRPRTENGAKIKVRAFWGRA